jgi:hypothetical protein
VRVQSETRMPTLGVTILSVVNVCVCVSVVVVVVVVVVGIGVGSDDITVQKNLSPILAQPDIVKLPAHCWATFLLVPWPRSGLKLARGLG